MPDIVIRCEGLGKSYLVGHQGPRERYATLRGVISRQARSMWETTKRAWRGQAVITGQTVEEFWALRDVSFEVREGEVVGIIGRNGAGKSTLLKVLSRITEPSEGRATLHGRVGSLLEVGTGFHPELTGRENIFLNGAILGMTRGEVRRKFDEIVAFAGVEKFLDTPVKRFSSGMSVRLGFAVAAHLQPEILVVDEVLAVGDAEFQKKCLGKMRDVASGGRTVLFVSHNMAAIRRLCRSCLLLADGRITFIGEAETGVARYLESATANSSHPSDIVCKARDLDVVVRDLQVDQDGEDLLIHFALSGTIRVPRLGVGVLVTTSTGDEVFKLSPRKTRLSVPRMEGDYRVSLRVSNVFSVLTSGDYRLSLWFADINIAILSTLQDVAVFHVPQRDLFGTGHFPSNIEDGLVAVQASITSQRQEPCTATKASRV